MGDCDILLAVLLVASCSTPSSSGSNLLPPTTADADTSSPGGSRRPGDPPLVGTTADAAPAAADAPGAAAADVGGHGPQVDAPAALAADTGPALQVDAPTTPAPLDSSSAPPPADATVDLGVTWDANQKVTDCGITKPWAPKKSYPKYEFVLNLGHIFQCLGEPPNQDLPSPWSDCKSPEFEPGRAGGRWAEAWYDSGVCGRP